MSTTKMVFHGSDIEKICEIYHLKQENIVKFGANVNPLGLSENVKKQLASHLDILSSYPDRDYTSLRNTISDYCNVPANFILPGNGSTPNIPENFPSPEAPRNTTTFARRITLSWI